MEGSHQPASGEAAGGPEKLRLKVAAGNAAGSVIEVEDELMIGRQADGPGTLGNDIEISRRHARIVGEPGGGYVIEDLGSTNGTYVNGRAVESPTSLQPGDRIEVGASALIVQVSAPPPTPRSTPVTTTSAPVPEQPEPAAGPVAEPAAEPVAEPAPAPTPAGAAPAGPAGDPLVAEVPGLPRLGLRIEVDVEAREITVTLDEGGGEVRFVHADGAWRLK